MRDAIIPYENCFTCKLQHCKYRKDLLAECDEKEIFGPARLCLRTCDNWKLDKAEKKKLKRVEHMQLYRKAAKEAAND